MNEKETRPEFFVKEDNIWLHVRGYAKKHKLANDCTLKKFDNYNNRIKVLSHITDNNLCLKAFSQKEIVEMKEKGQTFSEIGFAA